MSDIVVITDSPEATARDKTQAKTLEEEGPRIPKHPLLDSISHRFQQNRVAQQEKEEEFHTKRAVEKAHSQYLKQNVVSTHELARAVHCNHLAKTNGAEDGSLAGSPWGRSRGRQTVSTSSLNNQGRNLSVIARNRRAQCSTVRQSNHISPSTEVIDVDTSLNESWNDSIVDLSNNADSPATYTCSVLNCEAVFTSEGALGQHMNLFQHSPCNPRLKAVDCKLSPDFLCYICPGCDREFPERDQCKEHMKKERHSVFLPPLEISAYMCPQCLYLFESFEKCWNHMEKSSHHTMAYPFSDDRGAQGGVLGPVSVPEPLVQDMIQKCSKVPYKVQCLECSLFIKTPAVLRQHMLETNNQHVVSSLTDSSLVDMFAEYIANYSCDVCHRLFNGSVTELAEHQCAAGIVGRIVENNTHSFAQFIIQCALSLVKSVEPEELPGPSRRRRSSSRERQKPRGKRKASKEKSAVPLQKASLNITISDSDDDDDALKIVEVKYTTKMTNSENNNEILINSEKEQKNEKEQKVYNSESATDVTSTVCAISATCEAASILPPTALVSQPMTGFEFFGGTDSLNQLASMNSLLPAQDYNLQPRNSLLQHQNTNFAHHQQYAVQGPPSLPVSTPVTNMLTSTMNPQVPSSQCFFRPLNSQPQFLISHSTPNVQSTVTGPCTVATARVEKVPDGSRGSATVSSADTQTAKPGSRERSRSPIDGNESPIATTNLIKMQHIIFLDLDNWPGFFSKLPRVLPDRTFVWGFYGGRNVWREPTRCYVFNQMKERKLFYLHEQCGRTKDAADFAIVLTVGTMHERLPKGIPFTIVSGDKGFLEVERQMHKESRRAVVIDPHTAQRSSNDMIYIMVTSVTDT